MYHLVYTSHATNPFTEMSLLQLLDQSRVFNKQHDISGILLYLQGKFIQVLEGDKQEVNDLYARIEKDRRHKKVTRVIEGNAPDRIFKGWSMGFKRLTHDEFKKLSGYQDMDAFFAKLEMTKDSRMVMVFLRLFYNKNMVDHPELSQQ